MVAEPITDLQWGKADWTDYENNWREKDAEYLQSRVILRYQDATARDASLGAGVGGMVVYNDALDRLEWRSKLGGWKGVVSMPANLAVPTDSAAVVHFAHNLAAGKGIQFTPTDIKVTGPLDVLSGVVKVDTPGLSIKVGAATALLSTDATDLVSSLPLKVPSLSLTGAGTVISAPTKTIEIGTLAATAITATNIGMTGTLTGGVINGTSGAIGGVVLGGAAGANVVSAPSGVYTGTGGVGYLVADATKAILGARVLPAGTLKAGRVEVDDNVGLYGTLVNLNADMAVRNKSLLWYDSGNVFRANYACSVYSATDPGATNFPEGTIWFS